MLHAPLVVHNSVNPTYSMSSPTVKPCTAIVKISDKPNKKPQALHKKSFLIIDDVQDLRSGKLASVEKAFMNYRHAPLDITGFMYQKYKY